MAHGVLVVTRFIVPDEPPERVAEFVANARSAARRLPGPARPRAHHARPHSLEDPTRWVLVSEWDRGRRLAPGTVVV